MICKSLNNLQFSGKGKVKQTGLWQVGNHKDSKKIIIVKALCISRLLKRVRSLQLPAAQKYLKLSEMGRLIHNMSASQKSDSLNGEEDIKLK